MYLRAEKQTVAEYIKILRRVFKYNTVWTNKDLEIVQMSSGSTPGIYQKYSEEAERYPIITIGDGGGKYNNTAINNVVQVYDNDQYHMGIRMQGMELIDSNSSISVKIPDDVRGQTVRGIFTYIGFSELSYSEDDLKVFLIKDLLTTPVILASGSYENISHLTLEKEYTELFPTTLLDNVTDYWVQFKVPIDSEVSYYIGMDTSSALTYVYGSNPSAIGSVTGSILLPAFVRVGGMFEGSLNVIVETRNDIDTARDLCELVSLYTNLLKHAQMIRFSDDTINTRSIFIETNLVDEWIEKGIRIGDITVGESQMRRRSDNDEIFTIATRIVYYTDWFQDYPAEALKDITVYKAGEEGKLTNLLTEEE